MCDDKNDIQVGTRQKLPHIYFILSSYLFSSICDSSIDSIVYYHTIILQFNIISQVILDQKSWRRKMSKSYQQA